MEFQDTKTFLDKQNNHKSKFKSTNWVVTDNESSKI